MRLHLPGRFASGDTSKWPSPLCRWPMLVMCVVGLLAGPVASGMALGIDPHLVVVNHGVIQSRHWRVQVVGDGHRRGICLLVAADNGTQGEGESENAQCSAPAPRRGLVRTVVERRRSTGILLTVVGMAFNLKVSGVKITLSDGRSKVMPLRRIKSSAGGAQVQHFKYVAFAVRGPWCVRELVTSRDDGEVLWTAPASDLVPYDPAEVCS
jgi:hypothetical protein